jgi:hypothetical protein
MVTCPLGNLLALVDAPTAGAVNASTRLTAMMILVKRAFLTIVFPPSLFRIANLQSQWYHELVTISPRIASFHFYVLSHIQTPQIKAKPQKILATASMIGVVISTPKSGGRLRYDEMVR